MIKITKLRNHYRLIAISVISVLLLIALSVGLLGLRSSIDLMPRPAEFSQIGSLPNGSYLFSINLNQVQTVLSLQIPLCESSKNNECQELMSNNIKIQSLPDLIFYRIKYQYKLVDNGEWNTYYAQERWVEPLQIGTINIPTNNISLTGPLANKEIAKAWHPNMPTQVTDYELRTLVEYLSTSDSLYTMKAEVVNGGIDSHSAIELKQEILTNTNPN